MYRPLIAPSERSSAGDDRPAPGKIRVDLEISLLIRWHFVARVDSVDWTLGYAQPAVDAFVRVHHEHVLAVAKGIDRADFDAGRVLAQDAGFGDDVGHA